MTVQHSMGGDRMFGREIQNTFTFHHPEAYSSHSMEQAELAKSVSAIMGNSVGPAKN